MRVGGFGHRDRQPIGPDGWSDRAGRGSRGAGDYGRDVRRCPIDVPGGRRGAAGCYRSATPRHDGAARRCRGRRRHVIAAEPPAEPAVGVDRRRPQEPAAEASAAGNSAVMALGSLVSRGTGFLRTAAIGAALGGGAVGDAYTTAKSCPGMVYELLLGGVLASVLVPLLVRARKRDADRRRGVHPAAADPRGARPGRARPCSRCSCAPLLTALLRQRRDDAGRLAT